ncbi:MAG: hypothetical protein IPN68_07475 [Bacteroidetes bacterium]|nr:hypothetical protein [Bacteroidota bacterium]
MMITVFNKSHGEGYEGLICSNSVRDVGAETLSYLTGLTASVIASVLSGHFDRKNVRGGDRSEAEIPRQRNGEGETG